MNMSTKYEKIVALKKEISKISLEKIESDQISINVDLLASLKTSPTTISMSILEDLCVSLDINLLKMVDTLDVEIETKAIKSLKLLRKEELQAKIQDLKDENKELIVTLIEECRKEEDDYRSIDEEAVNYFIIVSKEEVNEKQLKGLLEKETEWEREYNDDYGKDRLKKLRKIKKNTFEFSQEATDDNGEFTYTYSLVESKKIASEKLDEVLITPKYKNSLNASFIFHIDTPLLYSISDKSYRKLFFDSSRVGKRVIPIVNGIGKDEFDSLVKWLKKELKF